MLNCNHCLKCFQPKRKKSDVDNHNMKKIILTGNPNVGKSVIFNLLTGIYTEVSNYPGTTVSIAQAVTEYGEIIDTPGTYSLGDFSEDEKVAKDIIKKADAILNVVSAMSLERDLYLTLQLIDAKLPLIVIVNQVDDAKKKGINIDFEKLQEEIGVKIIPAVATCNIGIDTIKEYLEKFDFRTSERVTPTLAKIYKNEKISDKDCIIQLLKIECDHNNENSDSDKSCDCVCDCDKEHTNEKPDDECPSQCDKNRFLEDCKKIQSERIKLINQILAKVISVNPVNKKITDIIELALFNPIVGTITAILILFLLFQIVGVFVAGTIVDFIYGNMERIYSPFLYEVFSGVISNKLILDIFAGEFGILTMAVGIIVGVLIPLIVAFYLFMAFLEDSGYLPRLAVFCDNALNKIGLNGRAVIPLILGFGCTTMAVISSRVLTTNKERLIATALLGISIPCAAQQGIIIALIASIGSLKVWAIYLLTIFAVLVMVGTVLNKIVKEPTSSLLLSLPPLRFPKLKNLFKKTLSRTVSFVKEASIFFVITSFIISILNYFNLLIKLENLLKPIVVTLLHLPQEFAEVFVMGLIRRDMASIGLFSMAGLDNTSNMSNLQILVAAIVITLFVPCVAMIIMVFKERGVKEGIILWLSAFVIAILSGALLSRILAPII